MKYEGNRRKRSPKILKPRDRSSSEHYMLDPLLVPRLEQFSYNNSISDVEACVEYLRHHYKEYARKQQGPFRKLVIKAIHIVRQKQRSSPLHRELKLQVQEEDHSSRRQGDSASVSSTDTSSDEAQEESFMSGLGDPPGESGDDGDLRAQTSVRKKRKRGHGSDKTGFKSDTDEDEVLRPSPSFNLLNSSLRTAYHGAPASGKKDVDDSEKIPTKKGNISLKQVSEDGEPTIVQAFAPPDVIAAAARAAAAKTGNKNVKQLEESNRRSDVAPSIIDKVASTELLVKPDPLSGVINAYDIGKTPEKSIEQVIKKAAVRIGRTEIPILKKKTSISERKEKETLSSPAEAVQFSDLGGIDRVLDLIQEIMFPLYNPGIYSWLGLQPIGGVLLHGPPGCGKTKLANAIAHEAGLPFLKISGPEVVSGMSGESEAKVRSLFAEAARLAPSIIFIDEIDSITSKRENAQREMERRIVTQLMTCMDELNEKPSDESDESALNAKSKRHVLVIGATNRPEALDPALRRPGRFDREILLGVPDENGRAQILSVLAKHLRLEGSFDFKRIARCTPGFVGADLAALTREAGSVAIKRIMTCRISETCKESPSLPNRSVEGAMASIHISSSQQGNDSKKVLECDPSHLDSFWWKKKWTPKDLCALNITMQDFEEAVGAVQPSTKREGFSAIPNVKWEDVGALGSLQKCLEFFISRRIKHPEDYEMLGLDMDTGFLLYGPPGCGKTLVAKAVANDAQANFIYVKGPELLNKYVGESEHSVRALFARARSCSPCIIFFDELDALAPRRGTDGNAVAERVLNQLLSEMDGSDKRKGIFLIGATNRPDMIDPAVLRPGRLGKLLYIPLPDGEGRLSILKTLTARKPISSDVDLLSIAVNKLCEGLSGADLAALVNEACIVGLQEKCLTSTSSSTGEELQPLLIHSRHFDMALSQISPSVSKQDMAYYNGLPKKFGRTSGLNGIAAETFV
ncbi:hypothetical protein GOP47_0011350 [Adiantum capillus-veneris]|uniref:AAA+ ATPase domain-containing protein n=1 Tax=Adiantum capillus-veneris TaxID=13818 RepID=A0A9D4UT23_ADICA|nr:hypothetical protein GOP47_0011350 [Adiantum capillus-veneris]